MSLYDFSKLLGEERFQDIEKIKTIGSTYMAVSGLSPEKQVRSFIRLQTGVCLTRVSNVLRV